MCGFSGIIHLDGRPVDVDVVRAMTDALLHRGPDDQAFGLFSLSAVEYRHAEPARLRSISATFPEASGAVGFNRLSIQDTSIRGRQPMSSDSGRTHIVFNGEIYNAPALRRSLAAQGVQFHSSSDTEVVLKLHELCGFEGMLSQLNGMFAICIIDLDQRALFVARDHFGIKPLYICWIGETVLLSSEAKSFLAYPEFQTQLNRDALDEYLMFRYVSSPQTLLKNVTQLEPGEWMRIGLDDEQKKFFWKLSDGASTNGRARIQSDEFEARLRHSVKQQMISDVPLGCQLSGGVDSSVVNKFAADEVGDQLNAFSVVFEDPAYSEEKWIDIASQTAGVHTHKYELDENWYANHFEKATWHLDSPLNHPNTLGIMFLAENARPFVTVLLSGEGADELLGGYNRFFYQEFGAQLPLLGSMMGKMPWIGGRVRQKLGLDFNAGADRFILSSARLSVGDAAAVYQGFSLERALQSRRSRFAGAPGSTHLQKCLNYSMQTYLPELLLRQDKMTMAASMENRVPFLDHELVEFVRQLPDRNLVTLKPMMRNCVQHNTKVVLKKVAERYFDSRFVYRNKEGFAVPIRKFFGHSGFRALADSQLLPGIRERGLFAFDRVNRLWNRRETISTSELETLWVVFAFEMWAQSFLVTV